MAAWTPVSFSEQEAERLCVLRFLRVMVLTRKRSGTETERASIIYLFI